MKITKKAGQTSPLLDIQDEAGQTLMSVSAEGVPEGFSSEGGSADPFLGHTTLNFPSDTGSKTLKEVFSEIPKHIGPGGFYDLRLDSGTHTSSEPIELRDILSEGLLRIQGLFSEIDSSSKSRKIDAPILISNCRGNIEIAGVELEYHQIPSQGNSNADTLFDASMLVTNSSLKLWGVKFGYGAGFNQVYGQMVDSVIHFTKVEIPEEERGFIAIRSSAICTWTTLPLDTTLIQEREAGGFYKSYQLSGSGSMVSRSLAYSDE